MRPVLFTEAPSTELTGVFGVLAGLEIVVIIVLPCLVAVTVTKALCLPVLGDVISLLPVVIELDELLVVVPLPEFEDESAVTGITTLSQVSSMPS